MFILGDRMIKHTKRWELPSKLNNTFVTSFSGAKTECIKDYVKLCVRAKNLDHKIMRSGTNDYNRENNAGRVQESIVNLANGMVCEKWKIPVSVIISCNDE